MKSKLVVRLLLPVGAAVAVMIGAFSYYFSSHYEAMVVENSRHQLVSSQRCAAEVIDAVDELSMKRVRSAMRLLQNETSRLGVVRSYGAVRVGSETVPNLAFGGSPQANVFTVVDHVNALTGAAATVFVRRGDDFVRISTNVKKDDGSRAVGTVLDPNGKAIAAVRRGEAFYGLVDILGKPYVTGYEPLRSGGNIVGILYVGYKLDELDMLRSSIEASRILENGFSALLDHTGKVVFHSNNISADSVTMLSADGQDWVVDRHRIDRWGYTVLAGYPASDVQHLVDRIRYSSLIGGLITILLLVGIIFAFFQRLIVAPVNMVIGKMRDADIHTQFNDDRSDEIGHLTRTFDQFVTTIRETLQQVHNAMGKVMQSVEAINAAAREMAHGSSEQAMRSTEVASAVEEISRTIEQNSVSAQRTAETALGSRKSAEEGGREVGKTVEGMRVIADVVNRTSGTITVLGEASQEIGEIITVIQEIADQTNLLALNAAIEAARAGDHGRGFAVVADEVGKLADRTSKATQQIAGTIKKIQVDTAEAVRSISQGTGKVDEGIAVAERAGNALTSIVGQSETVADMIHRLAEVYRDQSAALTQITTHVHGISSASQDIARNTSSTTRSAEELQQLVRRLDESLSRFALDRETGPRNSVGTAHGSARRTERSGSSVKQYEHVTA